MGATATAERFLSPDTLKIIALGLPRLCLWDNRGVLLGKLMYKLTGGVNPLIGSAGVSAVPMAARVSQVVDKRKTRPTSFNACYGP